MTQREPSDSRRSCTASIYERGKNLAVVVLAHGLTDAPSFATVLGSCL